MAIRIGAIRAIVSANTRPFRKGLRRAGKRVGAFTKRLKGATMKVAGFGGALTAAATGGGMAALVKSAMGAADKLSKVSDKLGITTEALAGMRHAAELTGVDTKKLDMAMQRMVRRTAEAAMGTGEAKKALKELGVDATQLAGMSPDQVMIELAKAMESVPSAAHKVRLAFKLFDAEGVDLVNTLALGEEGLREAMKEAEQFGVAISRVDGKMIENANDAIGRAKTVIAGVGQQLAIKVAPIIEHVVTKFTDWAKSGDGVKGKVLTVIRWVVRAIQRVTDNIAHLRIKWLEFMNSLDRGLVKTAELVAKLPIAKISKAFSAAAKELNQEIMARTNQIQQLVHYREYGEEGEIVQGFERLAREAEQTAAAMLTAQEAGGNLAAMAAKTVDELNALKADPVEKLIERWQMAVQTFGMTSRHAEIYKKAVKGATDEQIRALRELDQTLTNLENIDKELGKLDTVQTVKKAVKYEMPKAAERGSTLALKRELEHEFGLKANQTPEIAEAKKTNSKLDAANGKLERLALTTRYGLDAVKLEIRESLGPPITLS